MKVIWAHRLPLAIPERRDCKRFARATAYASAKRAAAELLDYSEEMMRAFLPGGPQELYRAEDFLDNDGIGDRPVENRCAVTVHSSRRRGAGAAYTRCHRGFHRSDAQVQGSMNAVEAITYSACFYVFRCLLPRKMFPQPPG